MGTRIKIYVDGRLGKKPLGPRFLKDTNTIKLVRATLKMKIGHETKLTKPKLKKLVSALNHRIRVVTSKLYSAPAYRAGWERVHAKPNKKSVYSTVETEGERIELHALLDLYFLLKNIRTENYSIYIG